MGIRERNAKRIMGSAQGPSVAKILDHMLDVSAVAPLPITNGQIVFAIDSDGFVTMTMKLNGTQIDAFANSLPDKE